MQDILNRLDIKDACMTRMFVDFLFQRLEDKCESVESAEGHDEIVSTMEDVITYVQQLKKVTNELIE